jgi:tagatose-1,6-bisphosphate aldolase non-catalytic subunit AgaZ/GatZ
MENQEEIIINDTTVIKPKKIQKPLTEAQKEKQRETMKNYYLKKKSDPEYIERQRLSSKTHYYKHKEEVLKRMKEYQKNKLNLAKIELLQELQLERQTDLHTGDITKEDYDKFQDKINDLLAHLHLAT